MDILIAMTLSTNIGTPVCSEAIGVREGITIKTIIEPGGEGLITGYIMIYLNEDEKRVIYFLEKVKDKLPDKDAEEVRELTEHGECGIAYEMLCTQIYEYYIPILNDLYKDMAAYGKSNQINEVYYLPLQELIASEKQ